MGHQNTRSTNKLTRFFNKIFGLNKRTKHTYRRVGDAQTNKTTPKKLFYFHIVYVKNERKYESLGRYPVIQVFEQKPVGIFKGIYQSELKATDLKSAQSKAVKIAVDRFKVELDQQYPGLYQKTDLKYKLVE